MAAAPIRGISFNESGLELIAIGFVFGGLGVSGTPDGNIDQVGVLLLPIILLSWLVTGCYAGSIDGSKGHDSFAWFAAGLFFGPLCLIAACSLSDVTIRRYIRLLAEEEGLRF